MYNLNYAFEVAEQHLDIPKMLDAEGNIKTIPYHLISNNSLKKLMMCISMNHLNKFSLLSI